MTDAALMHMSKQEEDALVLRARKGDRAAMGLLYRKNRRLIIRLVRSYLSTHASTADFDDLVQEGAIGLMRATEKYDPDRGFRFNTYSLWWVRAHVTLAVHRARGRGIRASGSNTSRTIYNRAGDLSARLCAAFGDADEERVADQLGVSLEELRAARKAASVAYREDSELDELEDLVDPQAPNEDTLADGLDRKALEDRVRSFIDNLPNRREREVLYMRYFEGDEVTTLADIAKRFGLSRERIRQLEEHALRELREDLHEEQ